MTLAKLIADKKKKPPRRIKGQPTLAKALANGKQPWDNFYGRRQTELWNRVIDRGWGLDNEGT